MNPRSTPLDVKVGDCLELMRAMPDRSVNLTFTSPPYEAARTYGIDFSLKGQAFVDWCVERYIECLRVTDGLVAWVIEGQTRQYRYSAVPALLMADLHRRGVHLRKPPVFHRVGIPGSGGPDWLRNDYEFIVCATNGGKLPWSDNTAMGHPPKWAPGGAMSNRHEDGRRRNESAGPKAHARWNQWGPVGGPRGGGNRRSNGTVGKKHRPSHITADRLHTKTKTNGEMEVQGYSVPVKANPGNVIKCKVGGGAMGHQLAHANEAPYPEALCQFFIRSFCPPDGTVLDPFSGSGTTAAVALKNGRNAIAFDVRESQIEITKRRCSELANLFTHANGTARLYPRTSPYWKEGH